MDVKPEETTFESQLAKLFRVFMVQVRRDDRPLFFGGVVAHRDIDRWDDREHHHNEVVPTSFIGTDY